MLTHHEGHVSLYIVGGAVYAQILLLSNLTNLQHHKMSIITTQIVKYYRNFDIIWV